MDSLDRAEIQRTVIRIISRARQYPENKIGPDTDLVVDLEIAGDDADEILLEIMKSYPIDCSDAHLYRYFGSEGLNLWQGLAFSPVLFWNVLIYYPYQRQILKKSPKEILRPGVLVSDLVDSAMIGKWTLG